MQIISNDDFAEAMEALVGKGVDIKNQTFAVGVSGGADSICLCRMMAEYARKNNCKVIALTVDHQLRPESGDEAKQVHDWLTKLDVYHETLVWKGEKPTSAIEEKARFARYDLLIKECKKKNIKYLCLAHNKNDNVETFFLRLAKSSGVDGLSGIKPKSVRSGIMILRPLLNFDREKIKATNISMNQKWIEDPSNENEIYERVKIRKAKQNLDGLGLNLAAVFGTMQKMTKISQFIQQCQEDFCQRYVLSSDFGFLKVDLAALLKQHDEIIKRVLADCIFAMRKTDANEYPVGEAKISRLVEKIKSPECKTFTLGGTKLVKKNKNTKMYIIKEERNLESDKKVQEFVMNWDRFTLIFDKLPSKDLYVGKLGNVKMPAGLEGVRSLFGRDVLNTIPAIRDKDGLLQIPLLGYKREKSVECKCVFELFRS